MKVDTSALERVAAVLEPDERDTYGILRYRTVSHTTAYRVAEMLKLAGYGVDMLAPDETWHKMWAVSAWGDYMITSEGPVPL